MTDFLMITDLGVEGLRDVLDLAAQVKRDASETHGARTGTNVGLFFEKPSLRTRVSCEVAVRDLGAHPIVLKSDEIGLGKRETVEDVGRVLDRYLDVLAFRVFRHEHLETIAEHASGPVINLLSDRSHPCQALADLQTIEEHRTLRGTTLTFVGDGNNVCHSLMLGGAMSGLHVRVVSPDGFEPDEGITVRASALAAETGGSVTVGNDVKEGLSETDVVYTDVWTSMGDEGEAEHRLGRFEGFRIDEAALALAAPDALFLHCLPAHRGEEVSHEVMEHERSKVFDQAENRMHAFKALLLRLTEPAG